MRSSKQTTILKTKQQTYKCNGKTKKQINKLENTITIQTKRKR